MIYIFTFVWLLSALISLKSNPQLSFIFFCMALVLVIIGAILECLTRIKHEEYEALKVAKCEPETIINNYYNDNFLKGDNKDENESINQ